VASTYRPESSSPTRTLLPRSHHAVSRADIGEHALKVLYRLKDAGYQAYLVGGGVRDLLLGREPKDFDIATDARPEQVRKLFRNCRLIGRRFRLAHVYFGRDIRDIVEVATFRALVDSERPDGEGVVIEDGRIIRDNVYGTIEEDALRRDFTVNSLYYDIADFSVVDYTGGLEDLEAGTIRLIGAPKVRYREDPVRMLRAVRFAAKLGFAIAPETETPLFELGHLLGDIAPARLFDEALKLFHGGCALKTFEMLRHYDLFRWLYPATEQALTHEQGGFPITFVSRALRNTDERINAGKPVTPAFLFAALLWEPLRLRAEALSQDGMSAQQAQQAAAAQVCAGQARHTAMPKRFALPMREIWAMQPRFRFRSGKRALRLLGHPRFRAAYDFMCLRAAAGEELGDDCQWWTQIQEQAPEEQRRMTAGGPKRPRRRRRTKPRAQDVGV